VCVHRGYPLDFDQSTSRALVMAGLAGFFTFTQGRERPPGRGVSRIRPDLAQFELCDEYAVALPGEQPRQIGLPAPAIMSKA
jgi:hypothetical protein